MADPTTLEGLRATAAAAARRGRFAEAVSAYESLSALLDRDARVWRALGAARHQARDAAGAETAFRRAVALEPDHAGGWMGLGHALRSRGESRDAVEAYRRALERAPESGEVWWSLAALKTRVMDGVDLDRLESLVVRKPSDAALWYALGRARADAGRPADAMAAWTEGGRLLNARDPYDLAGDRVLAGRVIDVFDRDLARRLRPAATGRPRPVFVVGLPRAGSTLIQTILGRHPDVDVADEPPFLGQVVAETTPGGFPEGMAGLSPDDMARAAALYRERIAALGTGRPVIVDKNPNNVWLIGWIACAMPDAVVLYARRDPLDQGLSAFGHLFPRGFPFTRSLFDIGAFWALADRLRTVFEDRFPSQVHTVAYEALIADQDGETRRLLNLCGLDWNPACLAFQSGTGPVHTASAEQVRRPIHDRSIGLWRAYDPWLDPLRAGLAAAD